MRLILYGAQDIYLTENNKVNLNCQLDEHDDYLNNQIQKYYDKKEYILIYKYLNFVVIELDNKLEDECPICFDNQCDVMTKCGHTYCNDCFSKLYCLKNTNKKCSICRKEIEKEIKLFI